MGFVETLELRFHVAHVLLFGDHAVFVGVHKQKKLFNVFFTESEAILRFGCRGFLCSGGAEESHGGKQDGSTDDESDLVGTVQHGGLLRIGLRDSGSLRLWPSRGIRKKQMERMRF